MAFIVVTHLQIGSLDAKEKVLSYLRTATEYSLEHEPGVTKHCITVPQKDDGTTIYLVEQYTDQTAFTAHLTVPPLTAIATLWKTQPEILSSPIKLHKILPVFSYTSPTIEDHLDPYIVFGTLTYQPETADAAIADFTKVGEFSQANEGGTLSYNVLSDPEDQNVVRTLEVYTSDEVLWDPHAKSEVVQGGIRRQGNTRIGRDLVFLKKVGGYLHK